MFDETIIIQQIARIEDAIFKAEIAAYIMRDVFASTMRTEPDPMQRSRTLRELVETLVSRTVEGPLSDQGAASVITFYLSRMDTVAVQARVIIEHAKAIFQSIETGDMAPPERNQLLRKLSALLSSEALADPIRHPIEEEHYQMVEFYNSVVEHQEPS